MSEPELPAEIQQEHVELRGILTYWRTVSGMLTIVLPLGPVASIVAQSWLPPDPAREICIPLTLVACTVTIFGLFYSRRRRAPADIDRPSARLLAIGGILAGAYLAGLLWLVKPVGDERYLTSPWLTAEAKEAIAAKRVTNDTAATLLDYFGHQSEDRIWAARWLCQLILYLLYAGTFAVVISSFFLRTLAAFRRDALVKPTSQPPPASQSSSASTVASS